MKTFLWILVLILLGTGGGFLLTRRYKTSSLVGNLIAGIIGSLGLSWLASLVGLGHGSTAFSVWGLVVGAGGALLLPLLICLLQKRVETARGAK